MKLKNALFHVIINTRLLCLNFNLVRLSFYLPVGTLMSPSGYTSI